MVHQYKLNGYSIVLDTCSGGVHVVDDVAYDVIALYPDHTPEQIAGALLEYACADMVELGVDTLYLLTDHMSFYERYGWKFLCMAQGDGEEEMARMYVHKWEEEMSCDD